MKPMALVVTDCLGLPVLNQERARYLKLMEHLIFRGFQLDVVTADEETLFALFGHAARAVLLEETATLAGSVSAGYALIVVDEAALARLPAPISPAPGQRVIEIISAEGGTVPGGVPSAVRVSFDTFLEPAPETISLACEAFVPNSAPKPALAAEDCPAMLCLLEPREENLEAVSRFVSGVWPAIHELCPDMVLRLPRGFELLGVPREAGLELINIDSEPELHAHLEQASVGVLPAGHAQDVAQKFALKAAAGLPCLVENGGEGAAALPLRYSSTWEAVMQAFRLWADPAFWRVKADESFAFAQDRYRKQVVYAAVSKAVKIGAIVGLGEVVEPAQAVSVPRLDWAAYNALNDRFYEGLLYPWRPDGDGTIRIGQERQDDKLFGFGFSPSEPALAWAEGYSAVFAVDCSDDIFLHGTECTLLLAGAHSPRSSDQLVTARVNGVPVAVWRVVRDKGFASYSFSMMLEGAPATGGPSPLVIALDVSDPERPGADEHRKLSVALESLTFRPIGG